MVSTHLLILGNLRDQGGATVGSNWKLDSSPARFADAIKLLEKLQNWLKVICFGRCTNIILI